MGAPYTSFIQQIGDSQDPTGTVQDCVPYYGHGFDPADPAWGAAFPLLANWVGKYYHDDQIFSEHYEQITAHIDNLIGTAKINNADGLLTYGIWGDWCPPSGCVACRTPNLSSNNSAMVSSFYYISELRIVAEYAGILGKTADQKKYSGLATAAGEAFNKHFYKAASHTYDENRTCGEYLSPQTMISLAAALNLIPEADVWRWCASGLASSRGCASCACWISAATRPTATSSRWSSTASTTPALSLRSCCRRRR